MATAHVVDDGETQTVRLPKEFRFHGREIDVIRDGDALVLREKPATLAGVTGLFHALPEMERSDDDLATDRRPDLHGDG